MYSACGYCCSKDGSGFLAKNKEEVESSSGAKFYRQDGVFGSDNFPDCSAGTSAGQSLASVCDKCAKLEIKRAISGDVGVNSEGMKGVIFSLMSKLTKEIYCRFTGGDICEGEYKKNNFSYPRQRLLLS